jgi:hypothetical protein
MFKFFKKSHLKPIKEADVVVYKEFSKKENSINNGLNIAGSNSKKENKDKELGAVKMQNDSNINSSNYSFNNNKFNTKEGLSVNSILNTEKSSVLGKKNHVELEELYGSLEQECNKWKNLAQRYFEEKKFIEKKILKRDLNQLVSDKVLGYLRFLKFPGIISILLIINLFLILYLSFNIVKEKSEIKITKNNNKIEIEQKENIFPYVIQVCVFEEFDDAKDMVNKLKSKGFSAIVNKPLKSKSKLYRVYVGNFETAKYAKNMLDKIRKALDSGGGFIRKRF